MYVYAGIDEAGYGPLFGPLLVGRSVLAIPNLACDAPPPLLWQRLSKAVCKTLSNRKGRIAVNDSKKLTTSAAGIKHLELGCLAFAHLAGHQPGTLDHWLGCLGETCHRDLSGLPWYQAGDESPWQVLPTAVTAGELAIARSMLKHTAERIGVQVLSIGAAMVLEDRFNQMVAATRSKAATAFTFVAGHLQYVYEQFGEHRPTVVVDRQGGRTNYRRLLAMNFPDAKIAILSESAERSAYRLEGEGRAMTVSFEVKADGHHMPVALASMISKYTRELMMARFNRFFTTRLPEVAPTAGYALDGKRFWKDVQPHLGRLGIRNDSLRRRA